MDFKVFAGIFSSVSDACFKCFICLQIYVANVSSGCSKTDRMSLLGDPPAAAGPGLDEASRGGRERSPCEVRRRGRRSDDTGPHVGVWNNGPSTGQVHILLYYYKKLNN
jgi:hypothetical protein